MAGTSNITQISKILKDDGSQALAIWLALNQSLQDADHVFTPQVTSEDVKGLKNLAKVANGLTTDHFNNKFFSVALRDDQLDTALDSLDDLSAHLHMTEEEVFSYVLSILYVPACFVDIFTLSAIREVHEKKDETHGECKHIPKHLPFVRTHKTRVGLIRYASFGAGAWGNSDNYFEFNLDNDVDLHRFERYQEFLNFVVDEHHIYTDVMEHVSCDNWVEANKVASAYFKKVGLQEGNTVDEPPALADFLILALTPIGNPALIAKLVKRGH